MYAIYAARIAFIFACFLKTLFAEIFKKYLCILRYSHNNLKFHRMIEKCKSTLKDNVIYSLNLDFLRNFFKQRLFIGYDEKLFRLQ